ncbi:hypothetical protein B0H19DRAFT_605200 [Mycena capillaripes]|nr:hypothetical protein B0H19DRAFT_605200 [Mycena capillaripes]
MADIVGLIASILQLVDGVVKAWDYVQDFQHAPEDQQQLLQEIKSLDPLIRNLDEQIQRSGATALTRNLETPLLSVEGNDAALDEETGLKEHHDTARCAVRR